MLDKYNVAFKQLMSDFAREYNTDMYIMSLFVALFVFNIGSRLLGKLIIVGAVISSLGYLLTAFTPSVAFIILSQSVLYGKLFTVYVLFICLDIGT